MYVVSRESTADVDKENAGTPARIKMIANQNTPASGLKPSKLATPGTQQFTPMRRPLAQVNHDVSGSTGRMLNKQALTPKVTSSSKTPRKSMSTVERPAPASDHSSYNTIVDDLTDQIMRKEFQSLFEDVNMKYTATNSSSSASSQTNEDDSRTQSEESSQTETCQDDARQEEESNMVNISTDDSNKEEMDTAVQDSGFISIESGKGTVVDETSIAAQEQIQTDASANLVSSAKFVSLLDPLKDWTFHSDVSLVTPVKALSRKPVVPKDNLNFMGELSVVYMGSSAEAVYSAAATIRTSELTSKRCQDVSSEMTPVKYHEISSQMTPVHVQYMENASEMTPVSYKEMSSEMTPVRHSEISSQMTPVQHKEMASEMTPVTRNDSSSQMTPVTRSEMSSQMTPVQHQDMSSVMTPVQHREMASEMTPVRLSDTSSQFTPVQHKEMASEMTPVKHNEMSFQMTPLQHQDVSLAMTPIQHQKMASEMMPVRHSDTSSQMTPVQHHNVSSAITPVQHREMASEMTPVRLSDTSSQFTPVQHKEMASEMTPVKHSDISSQMTPVRHSDISSQITPVRHSDISSQMTPVKHSDISSQMTPVRHSDISSQMTPVRHSDISSQMTPIQHRETSSEMTPIKHDTTSTSMTPVKLVDGFSETTRVELTDTSLDPIPIATVNLETMTSPVKVAHVEVSTEHLSLVHAEVGMTPVRTVESGCAMTPHQMADKATSITPVVVSEMETETSPMVVPVYRWEAEKQQTADPATLLGHLETASISNQLLRREVQMWTEKHAAVNQQLSRARDDLKKKRVVKKEEDHRVTVRKEEDHKVTQVQSLAKVSLEKDVEDLMSQIGEQMMQIGELQNQIDKKSKEVEAAYQEKIECQEGYQKEIHNLQEDLKTSYRQHQQEIAKLEDEVKRNNYKPHYERAQETIKTLQMEVEAFSGLGDAMNRAATLQEEFGCLEETFNNVMSLFQKTVAKKQVWQSENKSMKAQMETSQQQLQDAQSHLKEVETARNQLEFDMQGVKQKAESAQSLNQTLSAEIESANSTIEDLRKQLHTSKLDALGFQEDFKKSSAQCKELEEANMTAHIKEQSLEAAVLVQENQWKDSQQQAENMKKSLQDRIAELEQQCESLTKTKAELQEQWNITEERRSVLQADLGLSRNTVEEQWEELERLRHENGQMNTKIKELQDNSDFLEEERHSLVDAAKEADDNLRVTTLELSRCKVLLEESESARKQWETAVENISEKLQETQLELDNTKAYAHFMLLNQGAEMNDAAQGLHAVQQEMETMMHQLKESLGVDLKKDKEISPIKATSSANTSSISDASSIVASVLNALQIKGTSTPKENSSLPASPLVANQSLETNSSNYENQEMLLADSITESHGSNIVIGQSGSSAFTTVRNSSNNSSYNKTPVHQQRVDNKSLERSPGPQLVDQVGQVSKLFVHILRGLITYASDLKESLQEVKEERDSLLKNAAKSRQNFDSDLTLVQEQLQASQCHERALQQELADAKAKLCDMEQDLMSGEQRAKAMANNLARFSDQKYTIDKLRQDVKELSTSHKALEMEKATLQQVLDDLVSKVNTDEEGHKGSQVYGAVIKENCKLKVELERVRLKAIDKMDHYEALNARANRQMKVLEGNWKKAEGEIYRLDDIFDKCKQLISNVPVTDDEDQNLTALREIYN